MPDDASVAEPPAKIENPVIKPSADHGAKFRELMAASAKVEASEPVPVKEPEPKTVPTPETPSEPTKPAEAPIQKPSSPLDALIAKEEPKKEEPAPDPLAKFEAIEKPKGDDWKAARGVMKEQSERIKAVEAELQTAKSKPAADPTEIEALRKERDSLKETVGRQETSLKALNAEYSDEFQGLLQEREGVLKKIGTRAKSYGADPNALIEALNLPESKYKIEQVNAALADLDPAAQARMQTLIETLDSTSEKIEDFRTNSASKWDEIVAQRDAQMREQQENGIKQLTTAFEKVYEEVPKSNVTMRQVEGFDDWNKEIQDAHDLAYSVLKPNGTADFNLTSQIALKGARYDSLEARYLKLHKDHQELLSTRKEEDKASPDFKGGKQPAPQKKTITDFASRYREVERQRAEAVEQ